MKELAKFRYINGFVYIYDKVVKIGRKVLWDNQFDSILINQITGIDIKTTIPGSCTLTINTTGNKKTEVKLMLLEDAKKAEEMIYTLMK